MKKVSILLLALGLAVLLSTRVAHAQLAWDFTYEGDVDLGDPNASDWVEEGTGAGTTALDTDPNDSNGPISYMQIDTLNTDAGTRFFGAPSAQWDADFGTGATVEWRARFYDGFLHNFGPLFGDGNIGFTILYLYDSGAGSSGMYYFRIEDATGRHYLKTTTLGIDLSQWNRYWVAITTTAYDFYVNDQKIYSGTPADFFVWPSTDEQITPDNTFKMGDMGTGSAYDLKVDVDYVRAYFGGAIAPGEGECGDMAHPYPRSDLTDDCYVDLSDFAVLASDWLTDNRP